jgi:hypothetical protein
MSHLRRFRTLSEYEIFRNSDEWVTPNVSAINDIDTIMYNPYEKNNYLRFTSLEDSTISLINNGDNTPNVEYSFDGINDWTTWDYSAISLPAGTTVYMRGNNPDGLYDSYYKYSSFGMTGKIESHGNIMSLLYGDDFKDKLTIPVNNCFSHLFDGCSSLTTAPELPAMTLDDSCYSGMFNGCESLTTAPELPAKTLVSRCYSGMFAVCKSLTTAPELPAMTLTNYCYSGMFYGCSSLTSATELPAATLAEGCYREMFNGCSSLNSITMLATDISAANCLSNWVNGVSSTGTFVKHVDMTSLPSGVDGIPEGWTVENA